MSPACCSRWQKQEEVWRQHHSLWIYQSMCYPDAKTQSPARGECDTHTKAEDSPPRPFLLLSAFWRGSLGGPSLCHPCAIPVPSGPVGAGQGRAPREAAAGKKGHGPETAWCWSWASCSGPTGVALGRAQGPPGRLNKLSADTGNNLLVDFLIGDRTA